MTQQDITNNVQLFLESLYEVRGKKWIADGEEVPADYVGMPDGLLPAVIRQSYAIACAMNREETFRKSVVITPDERALLGVSVSILQTDPVSDALRLQIMQMAFSALERHDPLQIWENPIDPIQMIVESEKGDQNRFHELLRGLRSSELFDGLGSDNLQEVFSNPAEEKTPNESPAADTLHAVDPMQMH